MNVVTHTFARAVRSWRFFGPNGSRFLGLKEYVDQLLLSCDLFQDVLDLLETIFNSRDLTNMDRLDVASYANTFLYCSYPSSKKLLEGCGSGDHFSHLPRTLILSINLSQGG